MQPLWFDDVDLDQQWTSPCRTVTESDVVNFATMTGDFNPLHVDHEFAAASIYRKPIAHGLLGLSWVAGLGSSAPLMQTLAFTGVKEWEFFLPVYFGDTLHVKTRCIEKCAKGKRAGRVVWRRQLVNQRNHVVQQGLFETLVSYRPPSGHDDTSSKIKSPHFARAKSATQSSSSADGDAAKE